MERFSTKGIQSSYGRKQVLKDITISGNPGECICIVGENGCGKSTLLNILAGLKKADGGIICFEGKEARDAKTFRDILGYVPQDNNLIPELSVRDNLLLWYPGKNELVKALSEGILHKLGIEDFLYKKVSKLSGGMKKKVSIACALAGEPKILLLDEPGAALDLPGKEELRHYLLAYKQIGGTIILATHEEADLSVCDRIYALKGGTAVPLDPQLRGTALMQCIK